MEHNSRGKAIRAALLRYIKEYIQEHSYPPSVREMGYAVGLKSTSSVQRNLEIMLKLGMIESDAPPGTPRAIRIPGMKYVEVENVPDYV